MSIASIRTLLFAATIGMTLPGHGAANPLGDIHQESIDLFEREGLDASTVNVWAIEIEPGTRYLYELTRPTGRLFQVEFDLTRPVDTPPTPWGHPDL